MKGPEWYGILNLLLSGINTEQVTENRKYKDQQVKDYVYRYKNQSGFDEKRAVLNSKIIKNNPCDNHSYNAEQEEPKNDFKVLHWSSPI